MDIIFCNQENCQNVARFGGVCPTHYAQNKYGSSERRERKEAFQICAVSHCDLPANARTEGAFCNPHYQHKWRGKDPEGYVIPQNHPARNAKVCRFEDCQKRAHVKEMCNYHYNRILKGRIVDPEGKVVANDPCSFSGCQHASAQTGLCQAHYEQKRLKGVMSPLRDYGVYTSGSEKCMVNHCKKISISQRLCQNHFGQSKKYGISIDDINRLWEKPHCYNPGCSNITRLHIDHDHETGKVRGLLCGGCNTSLGNLGEDVGRILGLAEYKRLHS